TDARTAKLDHFAEVDRFVRDIYLLVGFAKSSVRRVFCSISCVVLEPVAGLPVAERFTEGTARPRESRSRRGNRNASAPMFAGSSCTHTNSRAFACRSISAASSGSGNGL